MRIPHILSILPMLLLAVAITGCGGGASGGDSSGGGPAPSAPYVTKAGDLEPAFTKGIFSGSEVDTSVKVFSGTRAGEVSFYSKTLDRVVSGVDGATFTAPVGASTWTFRISYDPAARTLKIERPSTGTDQAYWTILEPIPTARG